MTIWNIVKNYYGMRVLWSIGKGCYDFIVRLVWKTGRAVTVILPALSTWV
jgi:hypothetical protein